MADQNETAGKVAEDATTEKGRDAFFAGRYREAFSHLHSALLNKAIRWFREEGVAFQRPSGGATPTDLIIALSFAAHAELRERGEDASVKLQVAASLFASIAELRIALEQPSPQTGEGMHEQLAELTIRSAMLGQVDMLMTAIELGWFDKLAAYEMDRERRRSGAARTNAKKEDARQQALNEATRIAGKNQTLSNEELARRILDATKLPTTVRTATEWVRAWRKEGFLPPIKAT
ncbi:MAG: hypothetical protein JHD15_06405 [Phenylobacterium sp.]|uniref:hypothetical protein n=1 Tax=Phenylobacterium sp. TaxID=1871053 RepID=UPI001A255D11|nr:hypothetical protein [Phenylobacterium sp.]MBJ7409986.1 hypothetical protein [Phenylobacterium sp.]